jgi:prevent-host-death family protein
MTTFNIADAKARLSELVQKALVDDDVVIARDNKPLVRLVPLPSPVGSRKPGSAKGDVWIADDFDAPLDDFSPYR